MQYTKKKMIFSCVNPAKITIYMLDLRVLLTLDGRRQACPEGEYNPLRNQSRCAVCPDGAQSLGIENKGRYRQI